jgi:hypothetical protein
MLAERAGLSAKHLGEIERGHKDPRTTTLAAIIERGFEMDFRTFAEVCDKLRRGAEIPRELTDRRSPRTTLADLVPAGLGPERRL